MLQPKRPLSYIDHLPPLGWLPCIQADERTGLRPAHRRLLVNGHAILDEYGFLTPELEWTNGILGPNVVVPLVHAYQLLRSAAEFWTVELYPFHQERMDLEPVISGARVLQPHSLLNLLPPLELSTDPDVGWISEVALSADLPSENTRSGWSSWLHKQPLVRSHSHLEVLLHDPYQLIQFSYKGLGSALVSAGHRSPRVAASLAMLCLGFLGVMPRMRCQVCFRLSIPQRLRCPHHSLSAAIRADGAATRSEISSGSRLAKSTIVKLGWGHRAPEFFWRGKFHVSESTLGGLLWDIPAPHCHRLQAEILLLLAQSPQVRGLFCAHFETMSLQRQLEELRKALDPQEWLAEYWPSKIHQANEWLETAHQLAPGRQKMSSDNLKRLDAIDTLLEQGHPKKDIASSLSISPSHLSHLLSRRGKH